MVTTKTKSCVCGSNIIGQISGCVRVGGSRPVFVCF